MGLNTDKELLVGVGKQIRVIRKKQGMALKDLAQAVGMEPSNLSVIENGKSNPQLLTYVKIAAALNCTMGDLFDFPFDYAKLEQTYTPRKHTV
jgi:transcriptional regulator with XRE-family HTH domain